MRGDALARGAKSATFQPPKVSQAKWDSIFDGYEPDTKAAPKEVKTDVEPSTPESD